MTYRLKINDLRFKTSVIASTATRLALVAQGKPDQAARLLLAGKRLTIPAPWPAALP